MGWDRLIGVEGVFARPAVLACLTLLPALTVLGWWESRRKRRALEQLGEPGRISAMFAVKRWPRFLRRSCLLLGLVLLGMGAAAPQWGRDWEQSTAPGRDLMVALDCSRSMSAETPSRFERARAALLDLGQALSRRGGHRVGLVIFVAKAKTACPLTHDYEHFREVVDGLDLERIEAELGPGEGDRSGTRIGRGIAAAVEALDGGVSGAQDVVLLTDGDDPARDGEWERGAVAAREHGVAVTVVGIGDPDAASAVMVDGKPLLHRGAKVVSRLEEATLRAIAERTQGTYYPARTQGLALGALYLSRVATLPVRETGDDALPVYQGRSGWFFGPAFGLLGMTMLLGDRPARGLGGRR